MKKLCVVVVYNTVVRAPLTELGDRPDTEFWLVASPLYLGKLSAAHRAPFRRVLCQEQFGTDALAASLAPELAGRDPDGVVFVTNDESCELACAALQARFGRSRWPAARIEPFVNKAVCKAALAGTGLRLPRHVLFDRDRSAAEGQAYRDRLAAQIGFPMVVKPVEGSASMGVNRLDDPAALRAWTLWAGLPTVTDTFEVDEYVDGVLFNCDSLIQHGEIIWSGVCRNANPCLQYAAGRTIGVHTVPDDDATAVAIREFSRRVLAVLRPPDGAVHMEIFRTGTGDLVFLEVAARPAGGDVRAIYLRCLGFDIDIAHFLLRAGEPYRLRLAPSGEQGGWFIHPRRRGRVTAIELPRLASEHRIELSVQTGDLIEASSRHIADPPSAQVTLYGADVGALTRDAELLADATFYRTER